MMEKSLGSKSINQEEYSASELDFGDIIKNKIGNGKTEIVFVNENQVGVNFDQEIQKVLNVIQEIQNKEKNITDTNEVKDNMYKLIETFDNLLRDQNNQSKFADEENIYVSRKIISTTLQSLNNMSERLIESTNYC